MIPFLPFRKIILRTLLAGAVLFVLLATLAFFNPEKFLCVDSGRLSADAIVVLGGGPHERRPERAVELFKQRAAPLIIVSGAGDDEINRQFLIAAGVSANAIRAEGSSKTTRENAEFSIKMLREQKVKSAIIVTSWYHSRRALKTFEHYAPEIRFYSCPSYHAFAYADWTRAITKRIYLEYLKLPGYWICYGVCPF